MKKAKLSRVNTSNLSGSLLKGFAILEILSSHEEPMGVTDIARDMDTPKSGVHRLLQVMREAGWVRQTEHGLYECSLKLWELGQRLSSRIDLLHLAGPAMRQLAAQTDETVHLSILDKTEVLYLEKLESPHPVRAFTRVGGRAPAYCVATGKALLAYADEQVVLESTQDMQMYTAISLESRDELYRELELVRRQGYAINLGQWRGGVRGLAAPIMDMHGNAVAAIGIAGPADRLSKTTLRDIAPLVIAAAQSVSHELGYHGTSEPLPRDRGNQ